MTRRGGRGGGRGRSGNGIGRSGWRNFNSSNNQNNRHELKFYPRGTGPDQQTESFTKVREHLILNLQSEFVNGCSIAESIQKGEILDLSKEISIKIYQQKMNQAGRICKMSP